MGSESFPFSLTSYPLFDTIINNSAQIQQKRVFPSMFVHELIHCGRPQDIAIIDGRHRITYYGLQASVEACHNRLYAAGIRPHDRVAIFSRNSASYIYAYMGINALGAIAVPINFQLSPREIAYILKDAAIHYILTDQKLDLEEALTRQDYHGSLQQLDITSCGKREPLPPAPPLPDDFHEQEPAVIIYTSGTTGTPKGAVLSHRSLTRNASMMQAVLHIAPTDNILTVLPMYHCFAWTCCVLNPFLSGAHMTILDTFTPKETIEIIHREQINVLYVVPSICTFLTRMAQRSLLRHVRYVIIGGTPLPQKIAQDFTEKFNIEILEGYGLSEASPVVAVNPPGRVRAGSIGLPIEGVDVQLADKDGQRITGDEPGELILRGDNIMLGYWNLPDETEKALYNGWLHTGDIARRDQDGYLYIVDRLKDMIISMGENIYPREIEELVYAFPGIREAAVIAIPDHLRGQAAGCYYTTYPEQTVDTRQLKKYLQKDLALYKIPREFHEIPQMPRTSTGKIAKRELLNLWQTGQLPHTSRS